MWRKQSTVDKDNIKRILELETNALITDFIYNHNGTKIAIADSQGNVFIYQKHTDNFVKLSQFKADDAAIWKLSWSDPIFGQMIAIASFKKKVSIFQNKNNKWNQIARHFLHQGSVNHVQWAPSVYGIKLYSAGSQGVVCIMQVKKNNWQITSFKAHQSSISSLSIKNPALNSQQNSLQNIYPTIVTVSKDLNLKVWRHISQARYLKLPNMKTYPQNSYHEVTHIKPHKQFTRTILFKKVLNEDQNNLCYSIISGSQDGIVKVNNFKNDKLQNQIIVHKGQIPVVKLDQSLTGKHLSVCLSSHNQQNTYIYSQKQKGQWTYIEIQ